MLYLLLSTVEHGVTNVEVYTELAMFFAVFCVHVVSPMMRDGLPEPST
jgi:hypothetical protein